MASKNWSTLVSDCAGVGGGGILFNNAAYAMSITKFTATYNNPCILTTNRQLIMDNSRIDDTR